MDVDLTKNMAYYEYSIFRNWENGGNVISFDEELTLDKLDVEIGDSFIVDVRDGKVCFVNVDMREGLDDDQLDLFHS
jgi:hypothetical protein